MAPTMIPPMTVLILGVLLSCVFITCSYKSHDEAAGWFGAGAVVVFIITMITFGVTLSWMLT
jgi:hypothetical protein